PVHGGDGAGAEHQTVRGTGSVTTRGFAHLCHPGFRAPVHLFRRYVFHVLSYPPLLAKWVAYLGIAVAPELILEGHINLAPGLDGAVIESIYIVAVDEEVRRLRTFRIRRAGHAREFIAQHQARIADLKFRVADAAA